ncbi:hypothetical protein JCM8208_007609 [Rhodotorula glutinis]
MPAATSSTAPSPGGAYHPLTQVPLDSPTSVLSSSSDDGDWDDKQLMRSSSTLPWRPLRSRLRAVGRLWRVVLAVASFRLLHALLPSNRRAQVSEKLANLSNALPALPEHGSFLHPWRLVKVDDPLISLLETRLGSTPPLAPYRLLLGTVQRSEGPALIEWVLHHLALGADHLVVFDSTPPSAPSSSSFSSSSPTPATAATDTRDLILPLVELGWVTLVRVDGPAHAAHVGAHNKFRREWAEDPTRATWSAFLDVNEYLVWRDEPEPEPEPTEDPVGGAESTAPRSLPDLLEHEFGPADVDGVAVAVPRVWMTACPHYAPPASPRAPSGVLERYTARVTLDAFDPLVAPRVLVHSSSSSAAANKKKPVIVDLLSGHERVAPPPDDVVKRSPLHIRRYVRQARECPLNNGAGPSSAEPHAHTLTLTVGDPALAALDRRACETGGLSGVEEDLRVVERGASLVALGARLEGRWPVFRSEDYSLSVLPSSSSSSSGSSGASKRVPLPLDDEPPLEPGTTLVVDSKHGGHPGFLEVLLSTSESRRALAVTYLDSGGAAFSLPPHSSRELVFAARPADAGSSRHTMTLTVVRQYAPLPSPERDPPSPCSIMGHVKNQPNRTQLVRLAEGVCKGVDPALVGTLASATWPHAKYRGEVVLSREIRLGASSVWAEPAAPHPPLKLKLARRRAIDHHVVVVGGAHEPAASPTAAAAAADADALAGLTSGHWALHSLQSLVASSRAERDPQTRLYTTETCPRQFARAYWDEHCGTHRDRLEREGVWRWVPDGARSYKGAALPANELRACLRADGFGRVAPASAEKDKDEDKDDERRRILVVGDSVSSHVFLALQCLVATHLGVPDSARHVRFRSVQYEALDLAGATGSVLGRREWDELLSWEWDAEHARATQYPHVVVLNVGLWPASWATSEGYALGLRTALAHLAELAYDPERRPEGPKILWRETTSVFPTRVADPLFQVNPRVRLLNRLAEQELAAAVEGSSSSSSSSSIEVLRGVYDMVSARVDAARDSAHLCPVVQGDVAEVVMHRICRGGLLER